MKEEVAVLDMMLQDKDKEMLLECTQLREQLAAQSKAVADKEADLARVRLEMQADMDEYRGARPAREGGRGGEGAGSGGKGKCVC